MKFCAGVILYNPTKEEINKIGEISSSGLFDQLIFFDNSANPNNDIRAYEKNKYIFNGKNEGLAIPYNKMIQMALLNKCDYVCLLDQDSDYLPSEIKKMMDFISENDELLCDTAVIAPRSYAASSRRVNKAEKLTQTDYVINSGSFLNIKCVKKFKLSYDENIFLDGLDFDFCWTAREYGCKIQIYENSILEQNLGYTTGDSSFTKHSAFRYYCMAHNRKHIYKKHKGIILGTMIAFLKNIVLLLKIIYYEDNRKDKIAQCLKGIIA